MKAIVCTILSLLLAAPAAAAVVELRWKPVSSDVRGQAQVISHYLVYFGRTPRPDSVHHPGDGTFRYERMINAGQSTKLRIGDLSGSGHWFFAVAAANSEGQLSDYSPELHLAIPSPDGSALPPTPAPALVPGRPHPNQEEGEAASCATAGDASFNSIWLLMMALWLSRRSAVRLSDRG